jgi:hypothetical protein
LGKAALEFVGFGLQLSVAQALERHLQGIDALQGFAVGLEQPVVPAAEQESERIERHAKKPSAPDTSIGSRHWLLLDKPPILATRQPIIGHATPTIARFNPSHRCHVGDREFRHFVGVVAVARQVVALP